MTSTPHPNIQLMRELVDISTSEHFLVFSIDTTGGHKVEVTVPMADVARPSAVLSRLAGKGWVDATDSQAASIIKQAITQPRPVVRVTRRTGWHGEHFVLTNRTIGVDASAIRFFSTSERRSVDRAGSLDKWQASLKAPCKASSYLTFTSALAMAGALLEPMEESEGAIFQLTGMSSTGKTLALRVGQSAMGSADISGVLTHDATDRALEEHLGAANDALLCIDELARLHGSPAKKRDWIRRLPHTLASGVGRARSKSIEAEHLDRKKYRLLGLSTGELPLESYGEREAGERVRYPDIPVPSIAESGIFDRLAEGQDAHELAAQAEATIRANYGFAYETFVGFLVEMRAYAVPVAKEHIEDFMAKAAPDGTSWDRRFAMKFAIVYAAAALASEWEILPFSVTHARNSILRLYRKARVEARTADDAERHLLATLGEHAEGRHFPFLKKGDGFPDDGKAWGFRRKLNGNTKLAVLPEQLRDLIKPERREKAVLASLAGQGVLLVEREGRYQHQLEISGFSVKKPMFYVFDLSKLP